MAKFLILGGAGYIGSTQVWALLDLGHKVWVLDDLSAGHKELVPPEVSFVQGRVGNRELLQELLARERFDCVMHFAAKASVAESVSHPELYEEYNVQDSRVLLEAMLATNTKHLVFSSTCAVFGNAETPGIAETHPKNPINPYGASKLQVEKDIIAKCQSGQLSAVALRYFNAVGAETRLRTGEWHDIETHIIPNLIRAALTEKTLSIFGSDYPTPDGTCIRDYIHVSDLVAYHLWAAEFLTKNPLGTFADFNLGSGTGSSLLELVQSWEQLSGQKIKTSIQERRPGDPPRLVADSRKVVSQSGLRPAHSLQAILKTAWDWELKLQKLKNHL